MALPDVYYSPLPLAIGIPLIRAQPFYLLGILSQDCFRFKLGFVGLGWVTSQPWQNQAVRKVRCTILSRTFCDLQVSSFRSQQKENTFFSYPEY